MVAEAIVSSGNLWMIKAVVSGGATAWVLDAYCGRGAGATPLLGDRWCGWIEREPHDRREGPLPPCRDPTVPSRTPHGGAERDHVPAAIARAAAPRQLLLLWETERFVAQLELIAAGR